jgi:ferredoxin
MSETRVSGTAHATVKVDAARCEGHGRCLLDAPEVFGYGDVTNQAFVLQGADLQANRAAIDLAISGCPEGAISWTDEE